MPEYESLVATYVHLAKESRAAEALVTLKKVASLVKPIMRARGWKVGQLAEFYPEQANLLGMFSSLPCYSLNSCTCRHMAETVVSFYLILSS